MNNSHVRTIKALMAFILSLSMLLGLLPMSLIASAEGDTVDEAGVVEVIASQPEDNDSGSSEPEKKADPVDVKTDEPADTPADAPADTPADKPTDDPVDDPVDEDSKDEEKDIEIEDSIKDEETDVDEDDSDADESDSMDETDEVKLINMKLGVVAADGAIITVTGYMPEGAYITAEPVKTEIEGFHGVGFGVQPKYYFRLIQLQQGFGRKVEAGGTAHLARGPFDADEFITLE